MSSQGDKTTMMGLMCQENFACSGSEEAVFECDECKTLQCQQCEEVLHKQERLQNHERARIPPGYVPYCSSCKGANNGGPVGARPRAAVRCLSCKIDLCSDCQKRTHSGGNKRKHQVTSYQTVKIPEPQEGPKMDDETRKKKMTEKVVSFLLVDETEQIQVEDEEDFLRKLDCRPEDLLKVVSIFGNTGDGKSHTLNHTFFYGREVFKTSPAQESCTVGVWAAFDPVHKVVVIDTEGLLGATVNLSQRTRLLLKVLAISDLVIYRTHADRLHNDLFKFLGDASEAYLKHFTKELKATTARCGLDVPLSTLGPGVIIFHETVHTKLLGSEKASEIPEKVIQDRFRRLGRFPEAFSSIHYKGTRTYNPPTDFSGLRRSIEQQLENNTTRSSRHPGVIYKALKALSDRFSGEIPDDQMTHSCFFPDEYFTCSVLCLSCGAGCKNSMNHCKEGVPHEASRRCRYSHQYDNRVFTCKLYGEWLGVHGYGVRCDSVHCSLVVNGPISVSVKKACCAIPANKRWEPRCRCEQKPTACYECGREMNVVPKTSASTDSPWLGLAKYAWSGYVIECPNCGVIYRSRQYWFGNQDPVDTVVRTEIQHVWPDSDGFLKDNNNAAQRLLDGMNFMAQSVTELSIGPTKAVTSWLTDQIAPAYWKPNSQILECTKCRIPFKDNDTKHHCRACGEGFCDSCSSKSRPVPERGWGLSPVRVCDCCHDLRGAHIVVDGSEDDEGGTVIARKVGEAVQNTLGAVATAIDIPLGLMKDAARPTYWIPDHEITHCFQCKKEFNIKLSKHHCRACGQGFCGDCSSDKRSVPSRGWDHPVRVCVNCNKKPGDL